MCADNIKFKFKVLFFTDLRGPPELQFTTGSVSLFELNLSRSVNRQPGFRSKDPYRRAWLGGLLAGWLSVLLAGWLTSLSLFSFFFLIFSISANLEKFDVNISFLLTTQFDHLVVPIKPSTYTVSEKSLFTTYFESEKYQQHHFVVK